MRRTRATVLVLCGVALVLAGCGKTAEQKKMEADLNAQIMEGHEVQMAKISQADDLIGQIDSAMARQDSLSTANPRLGQVLSKSELIMAKNRLTASKDAMEQWMQNHQPYNEGIKHDQAMAQLRQEMATLTQTGQQMDTAIAEGTRTIDTERKAVDSLVATAPRGRKK